MSLTNHLAWLTTSILCERCGIIPSSGVHQIETSLPGSFYLVRKAQQQLDGCKFQMYINVYFRWQRLTPRNIYKTLSAGQVQSYWYLTNMAVQVHIEYDFHFESK